MVRAMSDGQSRLIAALEEFSREARSGRIEAWKNDTLPLTLRYLPAWLRVNGRAYLDTDRPVPSET
jgi:hypothetical protein